MSQEQQERTPSDRFRAFMASITPERIAEIDRRMKDPERDPREIEWRDDPDPLGRDWDWLRLGPGEGAEEGSSPASPQD